MARWLMALVMLVTACGPATGTTSAGDAAMVDGAGDAGRTVADWQSDAATQWRGEMSQSAIEMQDVISRGSPADFDAAGAEAFRAAMADYLGAAVRPAPDAGLAERRAMGVRNTIDAIAPAYCRAAAAFRVAAPRAMLARPSPRVACSELPPTGAWWERWP